MSTVHVSRKVATTVSYTLHFSATNFKHKIAHSSVRALAFFPLPAYWILPSAGNIDMLGILLLLIYNIFLSNLNLTQLIVFCYNCCSVYGILQRAD